MKGFSCAKYIKSNEYVKTFKHNVCQTLGKAYDVFLKLGT